MAPLLHAATRRSLEACVKRVCQQQRALCGACAPTVSVSSFLRGSSYAKLFLLLVLLETAMAFVYSILLIANATTSQRASDHCVDPSEQHCFDPRNAQVCARAVHAATAQSCKYHVCIFPHAEESCCPRAGVRVSAALQRLLPVLHPLQRHRPREYGAGAATGKGPPEKGSAVRFGRPGRP